MKRITPAIKAIADAHILARQKNSFDNPHVKTSEEVFAMLDAGKTFEDLLREIEIRYCSVTSIIMSRHADYISDAYRKAVYKGFKTLLANK